MTDTPVLMNMLTTQMRYSTQRQAVLAQNVANIDTPAYKAQDLKKLDFEKMLSEQQSGGQLAMAGTSPQHLDGAGAGNGAAFAIHKIKPFETSPTGNSVSLEDEMAKVSDTNTKFQQSSLLLKKYTQMLHTAVGAR